MTLDGVNLQVAEGHQSCGNYPETFGNAHNVASWGPNSSS